MLQAIGPGDPGVQRPGCDIVLVVEGEGRVSGIIAATDIILALNEGFVSKMGSMDLVSRTGWTQGFVRMLAEDGILFNKPLSQLCDKAAAIRARDVVRQPEDSRYVRADASMDEAVRRMVSAGRWSLLVIEEGRTVGVLQFGTVFDHVGDKVRQCANEKTSPGMSLE
ncbi:MAG: CBS domain-containing protein [Desulfatibacillaceae bacterium]